MPMMNNMEEPEPSCSSRIWDAARETYSNSENTSEIFEIEATIHNFRQGDISVTQYFNFFLIIGQYLDMFEVTPGSALKHCIVSEIVEQKQTFKFLLGLNKNLDEVRERVMGTNLFQVLERHSQKFAARKIGNVMMGSQNSALSLRICPYSTRTPSNTT
ncbi:hypothetical protein CK203_042632 [Vitis vinifera]|uniref:Retrotransposon gag domain-containing protein n=1 Tax=Vitis vinifera TaxID=29760 RepID=A0A438I7P4_VITVI|nr:hypothetical protein CK203_042632 [Vitis vinifera]